MKPLDHSRISRQIIIRSIIITASLCYNIAGAFQDVVPQDTTKPHIRDSIQVESGTIRFIPAVGSFEQRLDSSSSFHSTHFIWTDAKYTGDLLWNVPGFFLRELGEPGQPVQLNSGGIDGLGVSVQLDGRPMNDPLTGRYQLSEMPIEYIEQIEVVNDSRSPFFGASSPAAAINFVSHQYNNNRPLTKLRYLQGPFEHLLTDAIFAQNVAQGVNVMAGFQRQVTDGRFDGATYDSWNIRARVRYNHSKQLNTWLNYFYNRYVTGLNGGIDFDQSPSIYDEVTALVRTTGATQTVSRRDFTLGGLAKPFADSSWTTQANLYTSVIEREYREEYEAADSLNFTNLTISSYWGFRAQQKLQFSFGELVAGAEFEQRNIDESTMFPKKREEYLALNAKGDFNLADVLNLSSFLRQERLRNENAFSYGFRFSKPIGEWLELFGGYSSTHRFPTMQEYYWKTPQHIEGDSSLIHTHDRPLRKESHKLGEVGLKLTIHPTLDFSLTGFDRTISNEIVFLPLQTTGIFPTATPINLNESTVRGVSGSLTLRFWDFEASGAFTYTDYKRESIASLIFPKVALRGELSYRNQFFDGALDGKLGVRSISMSKHDGLQFIPQHLLSVPQSDFKIGAFSTIDLYAILKLGDAHVLLTWENPFNVNYMITPLYPMPARNFKIGVNWVFTD